MLPHELGEGLEAGKYLPHWAAQGMPWLRGVVVDEHSLAARCDAHQILDAHFHHLIVVDGGEMIGMLSTFDFVKLALMD